MKKFFDNNTDMTVQNTPVGNEPQIGGIDGILVDAFATFGGGSGDMGGGSSYKPAKLLEAGV